MEEEEEQQQEYNYGIHTVNVKEAKERNTEVLKVIQEVNFGF